MVGLIRPLLGRRPTPIQCHSCQLERRTSPPHIPDQNYWVPIADTIGTHRQISVGIYFAQHEAASLGTLNHGGPRVQYFVLRDG